MSRLSNAYTYLFDMEPRVYPYTRDNARHIGLTLPSVGTNPSYENVLLEVDERDQRALVIFDGDIPYGGLPRNGTIIKSAVLATLNRDSNHARNLRGGEEAPPTTLTYEGGRVSLQLWRHFLLLPGGSALVRRYRLESFAGMYALVEVTQRPNGSIVTWRNSSY